MNIYDFVKKNGSVITFILGTIALLTIGYNVVSGTCAKIDSMYARSKTVEELEMRVSMNSLRIEQKIVEDRIGTIELRLKQIEYDYLNKPKPGSVLDIERMLKKDLKKAYDDLENVKRKTGK